MAQEAAEEPLIEPLMEPEGESYEETPQVRGGNRDGGGASLKSEVTPSWVGGPQHDRAGLGVFNNSGSGAWKSGGQDRWQMVPNARPQAQLPWTLSAELKPRFLPTQGVGQTLFLLDGEGSGRLRLTTHSPTLPLCSSLFHPLPLMQEEYQEYEPEA